MRKLAAICVRRPVFATMLVLSLTVVGAYSFLGLGVDLMPNVDFPMAVVTVVNPGASPEQIETEITRHIEGAVNTISGIDELRSSSIEGQSMVMIRFLLEKNVGGARREIQVRLDPDRMRAYNISVTDVAAALRQQNVELPGGRIERGAQELTVRTMGRLADARDFKSIPVATRNQYVVLISDIGTVVDGHEELRTAAFLNGRAAVTLVVSKQSGLNTVAIAQEVKRRLAEITKTLPKDVRADIVMDQSVFIEAVVRSLEHHLLLGSLLASIVIFFFLANIRTTIISAIAIPISIISTFFLMRLMGYTLNQLTMQALTLMVGIVIDDAIIVLENIYRFIEEKGMRPFDAAIAATEEIGLAVMATTLSLMAVFVPVGFMGGMVGRFMASFGLTAAFAIGVSLIVSFTLTPMLCSRFIKPPENGARREHHTSRESRLFGVVDRVYTAMLRWSMAHRAVVVL